MTNSAARDEARKDRLEARYSGFLADVLTGFSGDPLSDDCLSWLQEMHGPLTPLERQRAREVMAIHVLATYEADASRQPLERVKAARKILRDALC